MKIDCCYSTKYAILKSTNNPYGKVIFTVEENGKLFAKRSWALDFLNSNKIPELEKQIAFLTSEVKELHDLVQELLK